MIEKLTPSPGWTLGWFNHDQKWLSDGSNNVVNPIRNHPHYQKCATKSSPMVYGRCIETDKISLLGIAGFISEMGAYKRITRMLRMLHNPPGISR